jgi:hypothetical protein
LTNALLTLLVVLLFGLMSSLFNSTMDDNREDISRSFARLMARFSGVTAPLRSFEQGLHRAAGGEHLSSASRAIVVLALTGLIYGFLSPDFGPNPQSLLLFISLVIGMGVVTYVSEGGSTALATRRFHVESSVRLFGAAIGVAIGFVLISRLTDFQPGFMYGYVASSLILGNVALDRRRSAQLVIVPSLALLAISLGAWLLLGPLGAAARHDGSWTAVLADSVAATVFVGGLEGLFYNMIPLTFMDGAVIYRWNRVVWGVMFGTATFLFWQLVINQYSSYVDALRQSSVLFCLLMLAAYSAVTIATWAYFRRRRRFELAEA